MTTLYEKRGRRYHPVAEELRLDSFPKGAHLVVCSPGSKLTRYHVEPDHAGLLAAAAPIRNAIIEMVSEKMRMRPTRRLLMPHQIDAWKQFQRAMGNDGYSIEYPSVIELADAVVDLIVETKK